MLNNINSTKVGLNQNLGKLQELGNVKNDGVVANCKPCAVWYDYSGNQDQWKIGDLVISGGQAYEITGQRNGKWILGSLTKDCDDNFTQYREKDRGDMRL